jgi:vacuolar-type H+-ATPase subunit F/Vma7
MTIKKITLNSPSKSTKQSEKLFASIGDDEYYVIVINRKRIREIERKLEKFNQRYRKILADHKIPSKLR